MKLQLLRVEVLRGYGDHRSIRLLDQKHLFARLLFVPALDHADAPRIAVFVEINVVVAPKIVVAQVINGGVRKSSQTACVFRVKLDGFVEVQPARPANPIRVFVPIVTSRPGVGINFKRIYRTDTNFRLEQVIKRDIGVQAGEAAGRPVFESVALFEFQASILCDVAKNLVHHAR